MTKTFRYNNFLWRILWSCIFLMCSIILLSGRFRIILTSYGPAWSLPLINLLYIVSIFYILTGRTFIQQIKVYNSRISMIRMSFFTGKVQEKWIVKVHKIYGITYSDEYGDQNITLLMLDNKGEKITRELDKSRLRMDFSQWAQLVQCIEKSRSN